MLQEGYRLERELFTMYLHKILAHSLLLFRDYNLAACSCEQGESLISIMNGILPFTSGSHEARLRKLLLSMTLTEERRMDQGLHRNNLNRGEKSLAIAKHFASIVPEHKIQVQREIGYAIVQRRSKMYCFAVYKIHSSL